MPVIKNFKANLRAKYSRYIKLSIIFTLVTIIAAFKFSPYNKKSDGIVILTQNIINVEDIANTIQKPKLPPPPIPEPVLTDLDEEPLEFDFNENDLDEDAYVDLPPPLPDPPIFEDEHQIFVWSEIMPEPVGGMSAIHEKVYYTEIGRRAGVEGTVVIEAVVDKQGNIIDAFVKIGIGGETVFLIYNICRVCIFKLL